VAQRLAELCVFEALLDLRALAVECSTAAVCCSDAGMSVTMKL